MEECYEDQVTHVHAIERGMSSNPSMNRRGQPAGSIHHPELLGFS